MRIGPAWLLLCALVAVLATVFNNWAIVWPVFLAGLLIPDELMWGRKE